METEMGKEAVKPSALELEQQDRALPEHTTSDSTSYVHDHAQENNAANPASPMLRDWVDPTHIRDYSTVSSQDIIIDDETPRGHHRKHKGKEPALLDSALGTSASNSTLASSTHLKVAADDATTLLARNPPESTPPAQQIIQSQAPFAAIVRTADLQVGRLYLGPNSTDALNNTRFLRYFSVFVVAIGFFIAFSRIKSDGIDSISLFLSANYSLFVSLLLIAWAFSYHTLSHLLRIHFDDEKEGRRGVAGTNGDEEVEGLLDTTPEGTVESIEERRRRRRERYQLIRLRKRQPSQSQNNGDNASATGSATAARTGVPPTATTTTTNPVTSATTPPPPRQTSLPTYQYQPKQKRPFGLPPRAQRHFRYWYDGDPDFAELAHELKSRAVGATSARRSSLDEKLKASASYSTTAINHRPILVHDGGYRIIRMPRTTTRALRDLRRLPEDVDEEEGWAVVDAGGVGLIVSKSRTSSNLGVVSESALSDDIKAILHPKLKPPPRSSTSV